MSVKYPTISRAYRSYVCRAKKKGHSFNLTDRQFIDIVSRDCFYCGTPPDKEHFSSKKGGLRKISRHSGIDRIDNALGYEQDNCVPCCTRCNRMKGDLTIEEFFIKVSRIYRYSINKCQTS